MLWLCPSITYFCLSNFNWFSLVTKKQIEPYPFLQFFWHLKGNVTSLPRCTMNTFAFSILFARQRILLLRKQNSPSSFDDWMRDVKSFINLENIRYTIKGNTGIFSEIWDPFITFFPEYVSTSRVCQPKHWSPYVIKNFWGLLEWIC